MGLFRKKVKTTPRKIIIDEANGHYDDIGYTRLRDNVIYLSASGNHKVLQIESSVPHECKTTVTANLGVSLSIINKKVLLVDLDLRRPRLHRIFKVEKENGLADYILGNVKKEDIFKKTEYKNVDIITRGVEVNNPSLVLVSDKLKDLIDECRNKYDYILFDCPPILQASDFIHISKLSDGVILLCAFGSTTKSQLSESVKELKNNHVPLLGSVLTLYDKKKDKGYSSYGKYYSYKYGDNTDKDEN